MTRLRVMLWFVVASLLLSGCMTNQSVKGPKKSPTSSMPPTTTTATTIPTTGAPVTGTFQVHYVNVGQGDATIWQFPDGTILVYDCGPAFLSPETNPVTLHLRDTLGKPFGSTLWGLVASHGHLDHIGGCEEVFASYQFQHVYDVWYQGSDRPNSYQTFKDQAVAEGAQLHTLLDDPALAADVQFHQWDTLPLPSTAGVTVQILWPPNAYQGSGWGAIADNSLVLRASHGTLDMCFQGDIETGQESTLTSDAHDLNCEVYLMGHHGSKYASGATWLGKLQPKVAPVSFGTNSYGHPTPEALCRVQTVGAKVYATHRLGTITITSDGSTATVSPNMPETTDYCAPGASYWSSAPTTSTTAAPTSATPAGAALDVSGAQYDPPGTDNDNLGEEWVQVTNPGSTGADLTGWTLRDLAGTTYSFPTGFSLAGAATVKVRTGSGTNSATDLYWGRASSVWNNDHDTASLRDADGQVVDEYAW